MRSLILFAFTIAVGMIGGCGATDPGGPADNILCYEKMSNGSLEVLSNNLDGSNPKNFSNNTADDQFPVWSPNGAFVAFYRAGSVIVYDVKYKTETNVTNGGGLAEQQIQWTANGQLLVAFANPVANPRAAYIMNPDGTNRRKIFDYMPGTTHCTIYACQDSRTFVYVAGTKVYKTTLEGGAQTFVCDLSLGNGLFYTVHDFDPLRRELLVTTNAAPGPSNIVSTINVETNEVKAVFTAEETFICTAPQYSQDYSKIVLIEQGPDDNYITYADHGIKKRFVHYSRSAPLETFSLVPMKFSPDGTRILFAKLVLNSGSAGSGKSTLYTVEIASGAIQYIDDGSHASWNPRP